MEKKRLLTLSGSLLLVLMMIATTSITAHAQQPLKLRVYYATSPTAGQGMFVQAWLKKVEQAAKGKVDLVFFPGAILGPPPESYDMIRTGTVDCGIIVLGLHPGRFPMSEVCQLPFIGFENAFDASRAVWALYEKFPEFRAEYSSVKVIHIYCDAPTPIGSNKPIRKIEDIKGMRIRSLGGSPTEMMKALGGTPVLISPQDVYTAMERKVIDGWMWSWEGAIGNKLAEVTNYFTTANTYQPVLAFIMNTVVWNRLSPDIQKAFNDLGGVAGAEYCGREFDKANQIEMAKVAAMKGKQIFNLDPEEVKRWREACKPVWDKWMADMEAKKFPGKAVLQETLRLAEKYSAEHKK
jgi:TRAP-type C4-dicarboxylate transport system substrate-binding protein